MGSNGFVQSIQTVGDRLTLLQQQLDSLSQPEPQASQISRLLADLHHQLHDLEAMAQEQARLEPVAASGQSRRVQDERLTRLNQCFLSFSSDPSDNIRQLTQLCGDLLAADAAFYSCLDEDWLCVLADWNAPPDFNRRLWAEGRMCHHILTRGQPLIIRQLHQTPYTTVDASIEQYGLQTYVGHPVKSQGQVVGSLCTVYLRDFVPTPDDLKLFGIIAVAIGVETERQQAEDALRLANEELEQRVAERTAELQQLNQQLLVEIQERQEAESALRQSEAQFRQLAENIRDLFWIYEPNDSRFIYISPACERMLGVPVEETYDDPWILLRIVHPDDRHLMEQCIELEKQGIGIDMEYRVVRPDGTLLWIHDRSFLIADADSQTFRFAGISEDITDRKQAEAALQQREARWRSLIQNSSDVISIEDAHGNFMFISPSVRAVLGYQSEDLLGHASCEWVHPDDLAMVQATFRQLVEQPGGTQTFESRFRHQNGSWRILESTVSNLLSDPFISGMVINSRDITERTQTRLELQRLNQDLESRVQRRTRQLQQARDQLQAVLDAVPGMVSWVSADGRYLGVNRQLAIALQQLPESVVGHSVGFLDNHASFASFVNQFFSQPEPTITQEIQVSFSGTPQSYLVVGQKYNQSQAGVFVGVDITERKQVEAALEYRLAFEALLTTISAQFINLKPESLDQAIVQALQTIGEFTQAHQVGVLLQLSPSRGMGLTHTWPQSDSRAHQAKRLDDFPWTKGQLDRAEVVYVPSIAALPPEAVAERQAMTAQGICSYVAMPLAYEGTVIGVLRLNSTDPAKIWSAEDRVMLLTLADILANAVVRRRVDVSLRQSEERFRLLAENTGDLICLHEPDGEFLYVSPAAERLLGYRPEDLLGTSPYALFHPEDRDRIETELHQLALQHQAIRDITYRMRQRAGGYIWFETSTQPITDAAGQVVQLVTSSRDVTERIRAEQALQMSEGRFRLLSEATFEGIAVHSQGKIIDANHALVQMSGYTLAELMDINPLHLVAPDCRSDVKAKVVAGYEGPYESMGYRKDGSAFPVEIQARMFAYQGEMVRVAAVRDITTSKQAEERIKASLREKDVLLKEIHHRVKNNLQVISSLLYLQAHRVQDQRARDNLQDSRNRVESMALVHESLYQAHDFAGINFAEYLQKLAVKLFRTYKIQPDIIAFRVEVKTERLINLERAIPCALIINELITNALKHGFQEHAAGEVFVTLEDTAQQEMILRVGNSHDSLPPDFDLNSAQSMGFELVLALVDQLDGTIELERGSETVFQIRLAAPL